MPDKNTAPDRIWADDPDQRDYLSRPISGVWWHVPSGNTEYVRGDLHNALQAENDRLREALRDVAQTLDWQVHGCCRGWSENLLSSSDALSKASAALK